MYCPPNSLWDEVNGGAPQVSMEPRVDPRKYRFIRLQQRASTLLVSISHCRNASYYYRVTVNAWSYNYGTGVAGEK